MKPNKFLVGVCVASMLWLCVAALPPGVTGKLIHQYPQNPSPPSTYMVLLDPGDGNYQQSTLAQVFSGTYFLATNGIGQNPTFYGGGIFRGVYYFDEVDALNFYPTNIFYNLTNFTSLATDGNGQLKIGTQSTYGGNSGPITLPVSGSYFMAPNNSFTNAVSDTSAATRCTLPVGGTLANLYATASSNPGAVVNTVTIFTNGVSTGITVTLNNVTTASDTTHTVLVLAGYEIGIQVVTGAGNAVRWGWGFQLR